MKCLSVILLSLFISVKSSTARAQDGTFHENVKTNANSSTATGDGTFHENAKRNGNAGLNVVLRNDAKQESQLTRFRRSLSNSDDSLRCYSHYFVGNNPPSGFIHASGTRYICQGGCSIPGIPGIVGRGCFSTLYDLTYKIPIYSAYVLEPQQWKYIGSSSRTSWRKETPQSADQLGSPDPYIKKINKNIDWMYKNTGIHKGHLVPAETYSFSRNHVRSTFVYTNAVPQYGKFNSGQWSAYERKIRRYGKNRCAEKLGTLYLLTGISDRQIGKNIKGIYYGIPAGTPKRMSKNPNIVIPNSMWTAGCCVSGQQVLGSFAVIGNNDPIKDKTYMSKVKVKELEGIIGVKLFPGNGACNYIKHNVVI